MNMRGALSIWPTIEESFDILGDYGFPAWDEAAAELGLPPGWFTWAMEVSSFNTEPFTWPSSCAYLPTGSRM